MSRATGIAIFSTLMFLINGAACAQDATMANCQRACRATDATVLDFSAATGVCTCGCRATQYRAKVTKRCVANDPPGSAEWRRDLPVCVELGEKLNGRLTNILNKSMSDKQVSGNLAEYINQACTLYTDAISERGVGGCASTCGRQACGPLLRTREQRKGKDFNNVAVPQLKALPACN